MSEVGSGRCRASFYILGEPPLQSCQGIEEKRRMGEDGQVWELRSIVVRAVSFDDFLLKGIAHKFCIILHLHFLKNTAPVGADGFHAERELFRNVRHRFPGCQ